MHDPKPDLMALARALPDVSGGRLRPVRNEADEDATPQPDAATFLKLDGRRYGRDIELYGFMAMIQGWPSTLADFAMEVVLPLKGISLEAHALGVRAMLQAGRLVLDDEQSVAWEDIFADPAQAGSPAGP